MKRMYLWMGVAVTLVALLIIGCAGGPGPGERQVITLDFITFWPSGDFQAAYGFGNYTKAITDRVEATTPNNSTGYTVDWNMYYAGTVVTSTIWSNVANGTYDIGTSGPGYSPGVFPLAEGMNYPGNLTRKNAYTMSLAKAKMYETFAPLQAEITSNGLKLLNVWSVGPGYFLMCPGDNVTELANFTTPAVKNIRSATSGSNAAITALGGNPVAASMDEAKQKFTAGQLDGILCPTDTPKGFGLAEYVQSATYAPCTYDFVFFTVMNPAKWNSLPQAVKDAIDYVDAKYSSGNASYYGQLRTWGEYDGLQYCYSYYSAKNETFYYYDLPAANATEYANWVAAVAPLIDTWIGNSTTRADLWGNYTLWDNWYATNAPYSTWTTPYPTPPSPP
jgi:TRAP-type C4-dicarboxylate transport system substrate-binding protein